MLYSSVDYLDVEYSAEVNLPHTRLQMFHMRPCSCHDERSHWQKGAEYQPDGGNCVPTESRSFETNADSPRVDSKAENQRPHRKMIVTFIPPAGTGAAVGGGHVKTGRRYRALGTRREEKSFAMVDPAKRDLGGAMFPTAARSIAGQALPGLRWVG